LKQRLHWTLTITALTVAVFGVTPLGSATVKTGLSAEKALHATGVLARGPRGPRGLRGKRGSRGKKGPQGPRGAAVVARARSVGAVTTSGYPGTDDPLTSNTWIQKAGEDDLILGAITYQSPPQCSTVYMPFLEIHLYVDGTLSGSSFTDSLPLQPGGTRTFVIPIGFASGADTPHTLTVKAQDTCDTGAHYTVTSLKLDVGAID
jgi:hypothetical protein